MYVPVSRKLQIIEIFEQRYIPMSRNIQIVEIFEQQGQKKNLQHREIFEPAMSEEVCSSE